MHTEEIVCGRRQPVEGWQTSGRRVVAFSQDSVYRRQGHRNIESAAVEYNQRWRVQSTD